MTPGLGDSFTVFEHALGLRALRAEVLGYNIANADTPGYQARDFDFASEMRRAASGETGGGLLTTEPGHINPAQPLGGVELKYRVPEQPSLDQNTVETHVEQAAFMDNAVRYEATLTLLNARIRHLLTAVTGQ